ncbi:MAG: hypothetical protein AAF572_11815 [Cyanobacteria bacterium P01_B01_bin.77]
MTACPSLAMGLVLLGAAPTLAKDVALTFDATSVKPPVATTVTRTDTVSLSFAPTQTQVPKPQAPVTHVVMHTLETLFQGGSHSIVARAVGSAEGTRTTDGGYTSAYYGHVDPGNHKWNLGSFSYQHGANSPAEADDKQLQRLYEQALTLRQQASQHQVTLSLAEELNGIDLANQAPLAALDRGYIDWLAVARQQPMGERDRIIWARTRAFLDPDSGHWNAPGLGNTLESIRWDQARRQQAVQQAIDHTN